MPCSTGSGMNMRSEENGAGTGIPPLRILWRVKEEYFFAVASAGKRHKEVKSEGEKWNLKLSDGTYEEYNECNFAGFGNPSVYRLRY